MASFDTAIKVVLTNEGGYANNPADPGGETYKGISRVNWPQWAGWVTVDAQKSNVGFPAILDKDSALQQAVLDFYKLNFWGPAYEALTSDAVATKVFDMAVNMDSEQAWSILQRALNGIGVKVVVTEKIDEQTVAGANKAREDRLLKELRARQAFRYAKIVMRRPTSMPFLLTWMRRVQSC